MTVVFYLAAAVALVATALVVTRLHAIHALLYLIVSLLAVAVAFFALGAPFAAALEVIVYAGAIMVLFVFAVMILNLGDAVRQESAWLSGSMWIGPGVLALVLLAEVVWMIAAGGPPTAGQLAGEALVGPTAVGRSLFGRYVVGVELAGILLLAGLVGAYHLGRRDRPSAPPASSDRGTEAPAEKGAS